MAENANVRSRWTIKRGMNRFFAVLAACWYLVAAQILWSQWSASITAQREARRIETGAPNAGGTLSVFVDEFEETSPTRPASIPPATRGTQTNPKSRMSPMRFRAWKEAANVARESRPIGLTATLLLGPIGFYALVSALVWAGRGFRTNPRLEP
jgi:hypothetical protein